MEQKTRLSRRVAARITSRGPALEESFRGSECPTRATLSCFVSCFATAKGSGTLKIMRNRDPIHHTALAANDEREQPALPRADVFTRRAAVTAVSLLFVGWETPGRASPPSPTKKLEAMSDPRVKTYEIYLSAWSAIPDDERAKRLRESLSEGVVFTNPTQTRHGLADVAVHLQGFQQRSPGGSFRMNEMLGWENHGIATWQFVDAQGQPGFWGYDVLAYDGQGRIESILLFAHVEKQMLK
jgi:SnoaL-like domain